jgi:hypothetical protein
MAEAENRLTNPEIQYERRDVPLWLLAALAGGLAGSVILSVIAILLIFPGALSMKPDAPRAEAPAPRLQADPVADMDAFRAGEDRELSTYGWIDKQHKIVRLPIEQAMKLVVERGIKDWPSGEKK